MPSTMVAGAVDWDMHADSFVSEGRIQFNNMTKEAHALAAWDIVDLNASASYRSDQHHVVVHALPFHVSKHIDVIVVDVGASLDEKLVYTKGQWNQHPNTSAHYVQPMRAAVEVMQVAVDSGYQTGQHQGSM